MAKNTVQAKKEKKPNKALIWIIQFIKALFSNKAAIEGANQSKWYVALIMMLFSVCLAVLPITINAVNVTGASYLGSYPYGSDTSLTLASKYFKENNQKFVVEEDKMLHYYVDGVDVSNQYKNKTADSYSEYMVYQNIGDTNHQIEFVVYYSSDVFATVKNIVTWIDSDLNYIVGGTTRKGENDPEDTKYYMSSYLILYSEGMNLVIYKPDTNTKYAYTNFSSDWEKFDAGYDLITNALTTNEAAGTTEYVAAVYKNWQNIINVTHTNAKTKNVLMNTFIYLGVYLALTLFMALMLFILTRGKKNVFNYLTFMDTFKMAGWISVAPAILAMILGFILASYAIMFFIILIGLRTMWLSMRQLRPY